MTNVKKKKNTKKVEAEQGLSGRFDFMGVAPRFSILSLVLVMISSVVIFTKGFRYGIDFAGGTEIQVQFNQSPSVAEIRSFLESLVGHQVVVQTLGEKNEILIRMQTVGGKDEKEINRENNLRIKNVTKGLIEKI